jgi:hypothetical protein
VSQAEKVKLKKIAKSKELMSRTRHSGRQMSSDKKSGIRNKRMELKCLCLDEFDLRRLTISHSSEVCANSIKDSAHLTYLVLPVEARHLCQQGRTFPPRAYNLPTVRQSFAFLFDLEEVVVALFLYNLLNNVLEEARTASSTRDLALQFTPRSTRLALKSFSAVAVEFGL